MDNLNGNTNTLANKNNASAHLKGSSKADKLFRDGEYTKSIDLYEKVFKKRFSIYDKEAIAYKQRPIRKQSEVRDLMNALWYQTYTLKL